MRERGGDGVTALAVAVKDPGQQPRHQQHNRNEKNVHKRVEIAHRGHDRGRGPLEQDLPALRHAFEGKSPLEPQERGGAGKGGLCENPCFHVRAFSARPVALFLPDNCALNK